MRMLAARNTNHPQNDCVRVPVAAWNVDNYPLALLWRSENMPRFFHLPDAVFGGEREANPWLDHAFVPLRGNEH